MTFKLTYYDIQTILLGQSHLRQTRVCLRWASRLIDVALAKVISPEFWCENHRLQSSVVDSNLQWIDDILYWREQSFMSFSDEQLQAVTRRIVSEGACYKPSIVYADATDDYGLACVDMAWATE